ncbi:hypothetical protein JG688_00017559 [Phytophthora aleatoria]|uniref:Uncharacterized protein n=1 Tax=Phytophthora aleatoria TaxID=2496075 RepID=A0A8J5IQK4_9STRA|nr:hypothetical protein JG688_00017559 [Phytophthora aleatoria]
MLTLAARHLRAAGLLHLITRGRSYSRVRGRQNHHSAKAGTIDSDTFGLEKTRQGRKRQPALRTVAPTLENAGTAGTVEIVVVTTLVVVEATSVSTLDVAEVTSGVGKLRTSLIMLLQEGLVVRHNLGCPTGLLVLVLTACDIMLMVMCLGWANSTEHTATNAPW